jgi:transcriptional regulator with XRE-family HTH domain
MGRPSRTAADRVEMQRFGQRLRWVREALGHTQAEMAGIVGLHQTSWSLYERGLRMPDQFEAQRIAAKLRISVEYMLTGNLMGVQQALAIRLAALHPELVDMPDTDARTDRRQA